MFISRTFTGRIGDKHGPNIVIIPAIIILMFSYLCIPFIRSLLLFLLISFPIGLSLGTVSPILNALIIKRCSPGRRGTASAAFYSAVDIGVGVGSILFGFIITIFSYSHMFFGSFLFTVFALVIYVLCLAKRYSAGASISADK